MRKFRNTLASVLSVLMVRDEQTALALKLPALFL